MSNINEELKKLKFHIRLIGEALDSQIYPIPSLVIEMDWDENSHQDTKAPRYTKGLYYKKLVIGALSPGFSLSPGEGKALMTNCHENKLI